MTPDVTRPPEALDRRVANWRELYREAFGFSEDETDRAGRLWTENQRRSDVLCADAANREPSSSGREVRITTVAARFRPSTDVTRWSPPPDHVVHDPAAVAELARARLDGSPLSTDGTPWSRTSAARAGGGSG